MQDFIERYNLPSELVVFIERGFLVPLREEFETKTIEFHIPSKRTTDDAGRVTTYSVTWIHPDFNAEFCHYYHMVPGDQPNFYAVKDTSDVGDELIPGLDSVNSLVEWLIDLSNADFGERVARNYPAPERLADEFCRILREWLDAEEIAEINRRNRLPEYAGLCASHDFCDPNQAMLDAEATFGIEFDTRFNEDSEVIDAAWEIAKRRGFALSETGAAAGAEGNAD